MRYRTFIVLLIIFSVGCSEQLPLPAPTPDLAFLTADKVIGWLRNAELDVAVIDEEGAEWPRSTIVGQYKPDDTITRVRVDGNDKVWIYAYDYEKTPESLISMFSLHADYVPNEFPTLFRVGNVAVLQRGMNEDDLIVKLYTSLWDKVPSAQLMALDYLYGHLPLQQKEAEEEAIRWMTDSERGDGVFVTATALESVVVTVGDYTAEFPISSQIYSSLPHSNSRVWAVHVQGQLANGEVNYGVVLFDHMTDLMIGASYSSERVRINELTKKSTIQDVTLR